MEGKEIVDRNFDSYPQFNFETYFLQFGTLSRLFFFVVFSMEAFLGGAETDWNHSCSTNHHVSSDWIFNFFLKFFNGLLNWGNGF